MNGFQVGLLVGLLVGIAASMTVGEIRQILFWGRERHEIEKDLEDMWKEVEK